MHELSIAVALVELAERHVPAGSAMTGARVKAGPLRGIDPDAMQMAWQQATMDRPSQGSSLQLEIERWRLTCPDCRREWESEELYVTCACGCATPVPRGGDDLQLLSIEVDQK